MSKPARSIHKKGRKNVIGSFMSAKMQVLVEWESQIERDFMYYLEFDDDVRGYTSQPTRYRYTREDKYKYHFPDFEIFRYSTPKRKFVEIKPLHVTKKTEFIEKTAAIKAQMHTDGFDYSVVTDSQLRVEPILSNLKLLYRYIIHQYDREKVGLLVKELKAKGNTSIIFQELVSLAQNYSLALIDCYSCISNKIFTFDTSSPLSFETVLTLSEARNQ